MFESKGVEKTKNECLCIFVQKDVNRGWEKIERLKKKKEKEGKRQAHESIGKEQSPQKAAPYFPTCSHLGNKKKIK